MLEKEPLLSSFVSWLWYLRDTAPYPTNIANTFPEDVPVFTSTYILDDFTSHLGYVEHTALFTSLEQNLFENYNEEIYETGLSYLLEAATVLRSVIYPTDFEHIHGRFYFAAQKLSKFTFDPVIKLLASSPSLTLEEAKKLNSTL